MRRPPTARLLSGSNSWIPACARHYWVDTFLNAVWSAFAQTPTPHAAELLSTMIGFAETAPEWQRGGGHATDVALALVGLDRWGRGSEPDDVVAAIVAAAREPWSRWVCGQLEDRWFAERALRFFGTRAAEPVLDDALARLAELEPERARSRDQRYDEALGEMLVVLMARRPELFTSPGQSGVALRLLLSRLAERGSALGLELVTRLA